MNDFNKRYIDFCKPFLDALKDVYSTMMSAELSAGSPTIDEEVKLVGDVSAMMGISGILEKDGQKKQFKGNLFISWPMDCYLKTASAMLMEEHKEFNEEIADVGMEICNITMGNAKSILNNDGYFIDMSIPTSLKGKEMEYKVQEGLQTIVTPMESSLGLIYVGLNYKDFE